MFRVPACNMHRMMFSRQPALRSSQWRPRTQTKKHLSTKSSGDGAAKSAAEQAEAEAARQKVLHEANETMKTYHNARLAKLRGELPSKRKTSQDVNYLQVGVVAAFMVAFATTPFLGRKIAQDKEFREKYVPEWYDFTIKRPTSELTREEVHEQILALQQGIRARAIAGEFSDEKINKMRRYRDGLETDKEFNPDSDEHAWSKLHPGVGDDEEVEEE